MTKTIGIFVLAAALLIFLDLAAAQQPKKVSRIGYLDAFVSDPQSARLDAFRQELRKLGYIEGQNITIEYRFAEGKPDRLPELAAELVRLKLDVIVVQSLAVARAARQATKTIPIIMADGADPVAAGLVVSLAQPGGNVTGLTNLAPDLSVKRLELLREILPKLARVAVLPSPGGPGAGLHEMQVAAPSLNIQLQILQVRKTDDLARAFEKATKGRAEALALTPDPTGLFRANRKLIADLAVKTRLPAIYPTSGFVNSGGLMCYTADQLESYRRAATYVDKILKGAKPAELPIERPTKFELVINLKAAKQIGLTIPPSVLYRADRVIR
jgi:putative ABC transport system substrate-binding protein